MHLAVCVFRTLSVAVGASLATLLALSGFASAG